MISPHGMDPQTVLRFVKTVHGWPGQGGRRRLRAGRASRAMGMELSEPVQAAVDRAVGVVLEQIDELRVDDAAYEELSDDARALARQRDPGDRPAPRRRAAA